MLIGIALGLGIANVVCFVGYRFRRRDPLLGLIHLADGRLSALLDVGLHRIPADAQLGSYLARPPT